MIQNSLLSTTPNTVYILIVCSIIFCIVFYCEVILPKRRYKSKKTAGNKTLRRAAPGPKAYPIIGNLAILDGYEVPYQAFTALGEKYGPLITLQLGQVPALVVNGIENIREVLITKTAHFDSRPNFQRYHTLFGGNKENSLAFSDWSDLQKLRRDMLTPHTFARNFSKRFDQLNTTISSEIRCMLNVISTSTEKSHLEIKPLLLKISANIFTQYFCSRRFDMDEPQLEQLIGNFDKVFWEVNQGYAADFLNFLMPLHSRNLKRMEKWTHEIRGIILNKIVENRLEKPVPEECDFVDSLIAQVQQNQMPLMDWDTALYALEDIVGGHSAVGNFLMKVIGFLAQNPQVQKQIQEEIDSVLIEKSEKFIDLNDRCSMQYTQAAIMEALRLIASPIVPHVSNQLTSVGGYDVEENTLIFLNNYELSMSPKLWEEPKSFKPERFLQSGQMVKPDFFLPFGAGRRSCMGYKLVQYISLAILSNILKDYSFNQIDGENYKIPVGSLAMPEKSFKIALTSRR